MSTQHLHNAFLRPAILHILRAAGFHSARPSVVDAVVDIAARYLLLLSSKTVANAYSNHDTPEPDISDVRMAMQECGLLIPSKTAAEEEWQEMLRRPLEELPEGARAKEAQRRDFEDTRDVRAFIDWVKGKQHQEIRRIAGLAPIGGEGQTLEQEAQEIQQDYLSALKKKHSKTGEESRFQGTILGKAAEPKPIKIEGGTFESIQDWVMKAQKTSADTAARRPSTFQPTESEVNGTAVDAMDEDVPVASVEINGHKSASRSVTAEAENPPPTEDTT